MNNSAERSRAGIAATAGLLIPVATTAVYMSTLGGPSEPGYAGFEAYVTNRWSEIVTVWLTETVGFAIGAIAALGLAQQAGSERASWNAVAFGSIAGLVSTAIGIGLFRNFGTAGEANFALTIGVLNLSFFFFFLGKALLGAGAAGLGYALLKRSSGLSKVLGGVSILAGVVALGVNIVAMAQGLALTFPGGLTGTIAALIGAGAAFKLTRSPAAQTEETLEETASLLRPQTA
ncbi:hypothetical protein [Parvularcula maris]|uniref:Uncharacterized protein n=1 Tax=Parvularcula maris TaxID=2965077 RepID=A0A9X2RJJ0_9PROT|nr:hypothetical protein [Parvularcula maris]MCQ8184788.1 hypothetical protein [Parvularcula maris]